MSAKDTTQKVFQEVAKELGVPYLLVIQDKNTGMVEIVSDTYKSITEFRLDNGGTGSAVIYDCCCHGAEFVVHFTNGFGIHVIRGPEVPNGELALKKGASLALYTVFGGPIEAPTKEMVLEAAEHARNLLPDGKGYVKGFNPKGRFNKNSVIDSAIRWYKGL